MKHDVNAIIDDDFWQVVKHEKLQEGDFEVEILMSFEHRSTTPTESAALCNAVRIMAHEEFAARHPHQPSPIHVNIDRQTEPAIDRQRETTTNRQPPEPIDRRVPLTFRVQLPKIDIARNNALRPQPKPSANPPETTSTHSEDAPEPMQVDKASMGRTLRKRKEKVTKHLKRGANEKEMMDIFLKRTKETEEDIRRKFHQARVKMKNRITLKKKSDPEKFAIPCLHCHCGAEYKTEYSASIETHTPTSIDSANQKSINNHLEKSNDISRDDVIEYFPEGLIDSLENDYYNPTFAVDTATPSDRANLHTEEYDEDYEEERATEYRGICAEEDRLFHHSYGIRNATSIDRTIPTSIDTYHHQTQRTRASTDIAYCTSFDNGVGHAQEGDYSIGSWADEHYHESYERSDTDSFFASACGKGTHFYHLFSRAKRLSIDNKASTSIDNHPKPPSNGSEGYARAMDGHALQVSKEDIADIVQMANGPKYQQHIRPSIDISIPTSIDRRPEFGKTAYNRDGIRRFHWEQKDEYGVYRDDHGHARGLDGHIIHVSKNDIIYLLERDSMDEHNYICLPEHARSFTQTKLVQEIYNKDDINEMLYGICGAQEKNEDDF
ncbi:hypothetical protein F2Q68_00040135 [Brassica cretica]|uniref:Uncharacterized protein n=1 Tax=Brassica cretica TaxID=69181 RepID=A0A8S9MI39_BRACR|nr:hypothetical protein F2Q68_00040135 [Brassica cretica]